MERHVDNSPLEGYDYMAEHPEFPLKEWKALVMADEIRCGYWMWIKYLLGLEAEIG